jgi:hypothetical protein
LKILLHRADLLDKHFNVILDKSLFSGGDVMKFRSFFLIVLMALILTSCSGVKSEIAAENTKNLPEFNRIVLKTIKEYPADGTHDYWWPRKGEDSYDGCTKNIFLDGKRIMKGEKEKRTYCCGATLEIFIVSYKKWLKDKGGDKASLVSANDFSKFKRLWFVLKSNGPGPSAALEKFKLGKTIDADEALPGDFIQIWRTVKKGKKSPSGHSVIFLGWVKDKTGKITGFKYWSTQPGTDGISIRKEYFGENGGVAGAYTYFARVKPAAKKVPKPKAVKKKVKKTTKKEIEKKEKK